MTTFEHQLAMQLSDEVRLNGDLRVETAELRRRAVEAERALACIRDVLVLGVYTRPHEVVEYVRQLAVVSEAWGRDAGDLADYAVELEGRLRYMRGLMNASSTSRWDGEQWVER